MKPIGSLIKSKPQIEQLQKGSTSLVSGRSPRNDEREFSEEMMLIVHDSFDASSQTATMEAKENRRDAWVYLLFPIIPTERLRECFERAFRDHNTTFAVNAYDLKAAWEKIVTEDREEREAAIEEDKAVNPIKYCTEPGRHTDDDGNVEILLGGPGGKEVAVPCPICRPVAHQQRLLDLRSSLKIDHPVTEKEMESKVVQMFAQAHERKSQKVSNPTEPLEIIGRLMNELGVEMTDARSARKRDYFHRGYIRLGQIAARIQENAT